MYSTSITPSSAPGRVQHRTACGCGRASSSGSIVYNRVTVHGRAGSLPKAGYRRGDAIEPGSPWPQHAVYPTLDELATAIGHNTQPFVLLMDPQDTNGFLRHWVLEEMGSEKHFAYALQWFAMGALLAGMLVWNFRRRRTRSA